MLSSPRILVVALVTGSFAALGFAQSKTAEHRPGGFERRPAAERIDDKGDGVRGARPAIVETQPPAETREGLPYDVREYRIGGRSYFMRPGVYLPYGFYGGYDPLSLHWAIAEAYEAGRLAERYDGRRARAERDALERAERQSTAHGRALDAGLEKLKAGEYSRAVTALTMAAKLNHGDPACRIHLAQARLALGHYTESARALRRALQLQPKLVYVDLKLESYFPDDVRLEALAGTLHKWIDEHNASAEICFLAGFVDFQRGEFATAHRWLKRAAEGLTRDDLTRDLLEITKTEDVATAVAAPEAKADATK